MTGFDDAFDAQIARSRERAQAADAAEGDRAARIDRMRAVAEQQLNAAGSKAVSKLRGERIAPVTLIADRGRLRRNTPVGAGWPLMKTSFENDYGGTEHSFGWFLLDDGRLAPNGRFKIGSRIAGQGRQVDQRRSFESAYEWLIEKIDIVEMTPHGYRFGGLVHSGDKYSTSMYSPADINVAFDESTGQLMYASRGQVFEQQALAELRLIPVEVAVAEFVAQAVLDPPSDNWR